MRYHLHSFPHGATVDSVNKQFDEHLNNLKLQINALNNKMPLLQTVHLLYTSQHLFILYEIEFEIKVFNKFLLKNRTRSRLGKLLILLFNLNLKFDRIA